MKYNFSKHSKAFTWWYYFMYEVFSLLIVILVTVSFIFDIMTDYDWHDLNFQVIKPLNTSELWVYLITKTLVYVGVSPTLEVPGLT